MSFALRDAQGRDVSVGQVLRIGSQPGNQIVLSDPLVSPVHATVWEQQGILYVRDENTLQGVFVNSARVQLATLRPGDQIRVGNAVFVVTKPSSAASPRAAKGRRRWAGVFLAGCLLAALGCGLLGIGGWVAYRAGILTPDGLLNLVGRGSAEVQVVDFRDDAIAVSITQLNVAEDASPAQTSWEMGAFDARSWRVEMPGDYHVEFTIAGEGSVLGECTLAVRSGDHYQFVALPEMIVIRRGDKPPASGADLILTTSQLCR